MKFSMLDYTKGMNKVHCEFHTLQLKVITQNV